MKLKLVFAMLLSIGVATLVLLYYSSSKEGGVLSDRMAEADPGQNSNASFLRDLKKALRSTLCRADTIFIACFAVTEDECVAVAEKYFDECAALIAPSMPRIENSELGRYWGEQIGSCTGARYEQNLASKVKRDESCKEALSKMGITDMNMIGAEGDRL